MSGFVLIGQLQIVWSGKQ